MKRLFIFITLAALNTAILPAQDVNSQVSQQVSAIRSGNRPDYRALERSISKSPEDVFRALSAYQSDTLGKVRDWVYEQYHNILSEHAKPLSLRQEIVSQLVDGLADKEVGVRNECASHLTQCLRPDFSAQAGFVEIFNSKAWFSKDLVLLAGFIGASACQSTLEELAYSPPANRRKLQWHANLALSRMGDNNAMSWCLSQLNRIGLNDDVVYELLPGIVYTRQHRMFEYLISVLNNDEKLCSSSNPDSDASILCGYRVMEYLAPVIKAYPLKQLPSGDIDAKDYHKALLSVRDWFAKKKGEYEILTDEF